MDGKLGATRSPQDARLFRLSRYLSSELADKAPIEVAYPPVAGLDWGMLGNDAYGDCTCAALGHTIQLWDAVTQRDWSAIVTRASVLDLYSRVNGGQDRGADPQTVLNEFRQVGLGGDRCLAYASLSPDFGTPTPPQQIKAAVWLFGGAYLAIALPMSAQNQEVWDVVPGNDGGPWGGHAVNAIAYDEQGVTIVTWGSTKRVTWAFLAAYLFEAYAIIDVDWLNSLGVDPNGNDLAQLQADLAALSAEPAPAPEPPAPPQPKGCLGMLFSG